MIDIDKLAGSDLDAQVAERVMGWTNIDNRHPAGNAYGLATGWPPDKQHNPHHDVPRYSTDIGEAWKVLETIFSRTGDGFPSGLGLLKAGRSISGQWGVELGGSNCRSVSAEGDSVPIAICRAALKAVGA